MKRKLNLTASILTMLLDIFWFVVGLYICFLMLVVVLIASAGKGEGRVIAYIAFALLLLIELIFVVSFVLSCISCAVSNKSKERFAKRKGIIVTLIVFNFLIACGMLFLLFFNTNGGDLQKINQDGKVLYAITLVVTILSNIFFIVDLHKEKTRTQSLEQTKIEQGKD